MTEFFVPALEPAATAGNLTNLIAERAWFEPERIMVSRPLGDGWQPVNARELEAEVRATAKGLICPRSQCHVDVNFVGGSAGNASHMASRISGEIVGK